MSSSTDSAPGSWSLGRLAALFATVVLLSPANPVTLVGLPMVVIVVAFRRASVLSLALCALVIWLVFTAPVGSRELWFGERAWALIAGGSFVVATLLGPRSRLAVRAIGAVVLAFVLVALYAVALPGSVAALDWSMASELRWTASVVSSWLAGLRDAGTLGVLPAALAGIVELQVRLYPALLALATVAALCVASFVAERLAGGRRALAPLREFGFSDQLIWLLIGGLILFILPVGELAARVGQNALAFMGGLYVLRGAAILAWLIAAVTMPTWSTLLWAGIALLFYPVVLGAALVLGISDTWLDLRAKWARAGEGGREA